MEQNDLIDIRRYVQRSPEVALQRLAVSFRNAIQSVEKSIEELKQIKTILTIAEFDTLLDNIIMELTMVDEEKKEENKIKIDKVKKAFGK